MKYLFLIMLLFALPFAVALEWPEPPPVPAEANLGGSPQTNTNTTPRNTSNPPPIQNQTTQPPPSSNTTSNPPPQAPIVQPPEEQNYDNDLPAEPGAPGEIASPSVSQTEITSLNSRIDQLNSKIGQLEQKISALEDKIDELVSERPSPSKIPYYLIGGLFVLLVFLFVVFFIFYQKTSTRIDENSPRIQWLKSYVGNYSRMGYHKEMIESYLLQRGFSKKEINRAFSG